MVPSSGLLLKLPNRAYNRPKLQKLPDDTSMAGQPDDGSRLLLHLAQLRRHGQPVACPLIMAYLRNRVPISLLLQNERLLGVGKL